MSIISKIQGCISVTKIASVNNYLIRTRGSKSTLTVEAKKAKEEYLLKLSSFQERIPKEWKYISLTLGFYFNRYFNKRDLSNCVKIFEDCLSQHFQKDDSVNVNIVLFKRRLRSPESLERIFFRIEEFPGDSVDTD